jgi:DNA invertase Pin-like site-specific DNA recombinase
MARIGYARVSTTDQDLDTQLARLTAEGCAVIRSEKVSGASREGRNELATIIEFLRPGDELVVARLDRLGRDTRDVLNLVHECEQRGAFVTVLDPHVSTRGEMGHVVLTVLGMVAQKERRFIKERQREGIERAKANGVYRGGKRRLDHEKVKAMHLAGSPPAAIAKAVGCSRMQVYRIIDALCASQREKQTTALVEQSKREGQAATVKQKPTDVRGRVNQPRS